MTTFAPLSILVSLVAACALLLAVLLLSEAIMLGPFATPDRVAEYRFGSEAMSDNGGAAYASQSRYVLFTAIPGLLFLVASGLGALGVLRKDKRKCLASLVVAFFGAGVVVAFSG